ncbi:RecT family protein [Vibrio phage 1.071.A._10N.286.46.A12]|nr:RecT family protein [Vibrio phage 1.071.A._10N.286.46.A12]
MNIVEFVNQQEQFFTPVVADDSINWGKESQFAIQAFQKNDYLAKIATSNPISAQNAIINVAAIGITLNPASKLAYLVPRDGGVCLDISYMGLLHIAQQAGSILWGQCKLVHANDTYESNGLDKAPTHKYQAFGERGAIVGGYCTVKTPDGDYLTEEMNLADIKKVAATSKAKKGPWQTFWEEMARKTIVKRASKYWPKVDRLDRAIHNLNTEGGEGIQDEPTQEVIIDVESHIISITEQKGRSPEQLFSWLSQVYKREIQCFDDMSEDEKQDTARKLEGKQ